MRRLVALSLTVLVLAVAACSATPAPPAQPSQPVASPAAPAATPSLVASPSAPGATPASPQPTGTPTATGSPEAVQPTPAEQYLLDGVRRGAVDCRPVRAELPGKATAGIECASDDPGVARVGFYLFDSTADMLAAYFARMDAEGVARDTTACVDGEGEGPYTGGDGDVPSRQGCFVNADGFANYRATIPGYLLYIGVLGRTADMRALDDFAWLGNQDTPGVPTLWKPRS